MSLGHLRSLLITDPLIVLLTIGFGAVSFVVTFFDATGRLPNKIARNWARWLLRAGGVRLTVEGIEKIDPRQSYVFVANHRSYMDTPVVLASIPVEFRFFAKKGLFSIPFLGDAPETCRPPGGRARRRARLGQEHDARRPIDPGAKVSVLLFPEGGRSRTGEMREFKEGAAYIAIKAGVPIVPVGIVGTRAVLPMGSNYVRAGHVILRIGDPIPTAGVKLKDREQLTQTLVRRVAGLAGEAEPQFEAPRPA